MDANEDDDRFKEFVFTTMRRLFRIWKHRLRSDYMKLSEEERVTFLPPDVDEKHWKKITDYWKSDAFHVITRTYTFFMQYLIYTNENILLLNV